MTRFAESHFHGHPAKTALATVDDWVRFASSGLGPVLDLVLRWFITAPLLASGILKVSDWQTALLLAANEYPVD